MRLFDSKTIFRGAARKESQAMGEHLGIGIVVMEPLKKGSDVKELKSQPDLTPLVEFRIQTWAQVLPA